MIPMAEKELVVCDECGSLFFKGSSQMMGLCPECAHILYGYPNCAHHFHEWSVCELLLGRLKECVHQETESTGGN